MSSNRARIVIQCRTVCLPAVQVTSHCGSPWTRQRLDGYREGTLCLLKERSPSRSGVQSAAETQNHNDLRQPQRQRPLALARLALHGRCRCLLWRSLRMHSRHGSETRPCCRLAKNAAMNAWLMQRAAQVGCRSSSSWLHMLSSSQSWEQVNCLVRSTQAACFPRSPVDSIGATCGSLLLRRGALIMV